MAVVTTLEAHNRWWVRSDSIEVASAIVYFLENRDSSGHRRWGHGWCLRRGVNDPTYYDTAVDALAAAQQWIEDVEQKYIDQCHATAMDPTRQRLFRSLCKERVPFDSPEFKTPPTI